MITNNIAPIILQSFYLNPGNFKSLNDNTVTIGYW